MEIRRAMPVLTTNQPAEVRAYYEGFLGFRIAMDEDGMLMLASPSTPTTQVIVAWRSPTAVDPAVERASFDGSSVGVCFCGPLSVRAPSRPL